MTVLAKDHHLILLAHGSSDSNWTGTLEHGLSRINDFLSKKAAIAYLEKATPSLDAVISKSCLQGNKVFDVLPLFFAEGRHLLHDVPEIIVRLSEQYPDITINLLPAIGCQDVFWEALGIMIRSEYDNRQSAPHDHREASGYTH